MKIKNTSSKVINVGLTRIFPDETVEVNNPAYENNPVIQRLCDMGMIQVIKERKPKVEEEPKVEKTEGTKRTTKKARTQN